MKLRVRKNLVWMIIVALVVSIMVTAPGTSSPEVLLHVDPPLSSEPPTETFDIYVTAGTEEEPVANLFLGEFTLSWDPPLLYTDVDNINLGDVAPYLDFIWAEEVNNDEGWLKVTVGRPLGTKEGLSGTVQIAKITFLVEAEGSCTLHLYDTRLKDLGGADLDHMTEDGRFEYPTVERGSIAGGVTDTSTGLPISGATVSAVGPETHSTTTAADGTYTLADIEVGTYSVTASATGYQDQTKSAKVTKGKTTTLDFDLTPLPTTGTISGTVTDADTTEPIEGATVTANGVSTSTNAEGYYEIEIEAGTYDVTAEASGYISDTKPATVTVGETTTVDFALEPVPPATGTIAGTVTDASTMDPIFGATVTAVGPETRSTTTAADGTYILADVVVGDYSVTASKAGYYDQTKPATVTEDATTTVDFTLQFIVGWIEGHVTDAETGEALVGATVTANGFSVTTDTNGYYNIEIVPGTYDVTAEMTGYYSKTEYGVVVSEGLAVLIDFALDPIPPAPGWIDGYVTDSETGEAIVGASITANGYSATTDVTGYYEIELPPGTYDVTAYASGYSTETKTSIVVESGLTTPLDFALTPIPEIGWIEGYVTDAETALPIEGATVTANGVFVTTGADGSYSIEIAPGTYTITAEMSGYYSDTQTGIVVEAGEITTLDFALELIVGWIDGYVTDADTGDAIAGATVTADGVSVSTDAEGYYKIEIAPETYTVTASMSGYYDGVVLDVSVTAGETVTVDFALEPVPPEVGWIEGTVTDAKTGSAIVGATVTADGVSVSTGAEGYYKIEIAPGMYTVTASMSGYVDGVVSDVTVTAGVTATVNFALEPLPGAIDGTVTDALTGSPIAGVYITADTYSAITDAYGYYMIADVQPGDYTVTASVDGYFSDSKPAHVESSVTTTVEFALLPVPLPLGAIAGTVKDFDTGLPIAGAVVSADGYSATTDESGTYSISDLEPKTYVVTASATGYESQSKSVTVTAGETATVDFALTPAAATIDSLIALVDEFYELGYIDDLGIKDSLLDKLYAAKAKIERGQARTAKNILNAFINHVKAQRGKHISTEKADILVSNAQLIINNL